MHMYSLFFSEGLKLCTCTCFTCLLGMSKVIRGIIAQKEGEPGNEASNI